MSRATVPTREAHFQNCGPHWFKVRSFESYSVSKRTILNRLRSFRFGIFISHDRENGKKEERLIISNYQYGALGEGGNNLHSRSEIKVSPANSKCWQRSSELDIAAL